jgi:hypothetical protein
MKQTPCPREAFTNRAICQCAVRVALAALVALTANLHAEASESRLQTTAADRLGPLELSPAEELLLADARDDQLNDHSLFAAALIASGAQPAEDLHARMQYALLVDRLKASLGDDAPAEERAKVALALLHEQLFVAGYDLQATALQEVFRSGHFNCVSATVLFNSLAQDVGLSVRAIQLPQHTHSIVQIGEQQLFVEATRPDWFDSQQRRARESQGSKSTPSRAELEAPQTSHGYRPISDVALVAMIYYNRAVEAMRQGDTQKAIRFNRLALLLDADNADAHRNLLTAINKRALELAARHQDEAAIDLIDAGLALAPDYRPLIQNRALVERRRDMRVDTVR